MTLQSPQPRNRRIEWAIVAMIVTILPWISVMLMAHEYLPGSIALTNGLFDVSLFTTYFGCWSLAVVVSSSPRLMIMRALATTLVVMTGLLILEVPAMLKLVHWNVVMRRLSAEGSDYGTSYVLDKDLGFRRSPNMLWSGRPASDIESKYGLPPSLATPITFTYDRWGYRNTVEMERASVVLIGDSYVEGWYVSDEQTVASRLAHWSGQCVANLGVAGYGTKQELRVLKGDALAKKPKLIAWFFFEGNDFYDDDWFDSILGAMVRGPEETASEELARRRFLNEILALLNKDLNGDNWKERSFTINAVRFIRAWSDPIFPNRAPFWAFLSGRDGSSKRIYFSDYGAVPWTEYQERQWEKAKQNFREGIDAARVSGADVILIYIPIKFRVYREFIKIPPGSPMNHWGVWTSLPQKFMEFCGTVSVSCLDLTERLQQAVRKGMNVYAPADTHWSSEGHAVVAGELESVMGALGLVSPAEPGSETELKMTSCK
jgi:hypothetical protein